MAWIVASRFLARWSTSAVSNRWRSSARLRSVMSRTIPVKYRSPSRLNSPIDRDSGNSDPSLRRPVTSRPMPMIFASPVRR